MVVLLYMRGCVYKGYYIRFISKYLIIYNYSFSTIPVIKKCSLYLLQITYGVL